jgi:hypothetical protein
MEQINLFREEFVERTGNFNDRIICSDCKSIPTSKLDIKKSTEIKSKYICTDCTLKRLTSLIIYLETKPSQIKLCNAKGGIL